MAYRLDCSVRSGEIDNRKRGTVTGRLWLVGRADPVQEGAVGDLTASRKVRVRNAGGADAGQGIANSLYLEWFSRTNGRVVIELTAFRLVEEEGPAWRMNASSERERRCENVQTLRTYMERLDEVHEEWEEYGDEEEDDGPMDEFDWELAFRESDDLTERYAGLFEKYMDHPDREKLIAREMGWDWLDDALDADERGAFDAEREDTADEDVELDPNPLTEGVDWVRDEDGRVHHPLCARASRVVLEMWRHCKELDLLTEDGNPRVSEMIFQSQTLCAKLAGALNGLAYDLAPDGGFVVASLKRALKYLESALGALREVYTLDLIQAERLDHFRGELFAIRQEMLRLMSRYREYPF